MFQEMLRSHDRQLSNIEASSSCFCMYICKYVLYVTVLRIPITRVVGFLSLWDFLSLWNLAVPSPYYSTSAKSYSQYSNLLIRNYV